MSAPSICSQNRRFCFIQCHNKRLSLILPFLKCKSTLVSSSGHSALCAREAARSRGMGKEVSALISQICLLSPYGHFQCCCCPPSPVSSFPDSSSCPAAASGKSQPLSGETAAGKNECLSSIAGADSRAGSLPILALLWLLYCSFTAKSPVASCPVTRGLQSQSQALVWVFPQASEIFNSFLHRGTDSAGRWSNSQISG